MYLHVVWKDISFQEQDPLTLNKLPESRYLFSFGVVSWWGFHFPIPSIKSDVFTSVGLHKNVFSACLYISEGTADIEFMCYFVTEKQILPGDFHLMRNKKSRTNYPNFIGVRLSDFKLDRLDQCANLLGISRSEYIRKLLIEKEIK